RGPPLRNVAQKLRQRSLWCYRPRSLLRELGSSPSACCTRGHPQQHPARLAWVLERKAHRAGVRPYGEKLVVRRGKIQEPKNAGSPEERYRNTLIKVLLGVERSVCGSQECLFNIVQYYPQRLEPTD